MKQIEFVVLVLATLIFASCSSDEPQWADPEAHEKTVQLRGQYSPFIVGTWHYEKTIEKQRAYEQLTFNADGTFSGLRKWQSRQVVTIDVKNSTQTGRMYPTRMAPLEANGILFGKEIVAALACKLTNKNNKRHEQENHHHRTACPRHSGGAGTNA